MSTATKQTPFQIALAQAEAGILKTPSVMSGNKHVDYFGYQLSTHMFNLKIMAGGMKFRNITFTQIKKYYGLTGRSARECVPQLQKIMLDYASRPITN